MGDVSWSRLDDWGRRVRGAGGHGPMRMSLLYSWQELYSFSLT